MKCIILAGGTGDALWPLSRQKYPKQFMPFRENRSLFQENVVRNMTFCDQFIIVTSKELQYVVESQMRALQGIDYRIIVEEMSKKTAIPVTVAVMCCDRDEDFLVVSSDTLVEGNEYQSAMIESIKQADASYVVLHGMPATKPRTRFAYVTGKFDSVQAIEYRPDSKRVEELVGKEDVFWNAGVIVAKAGVFLDELKELDSEFYDRCKVVADSLIDNDNIICKKDVEDMAALSIDEVFLTKSKNIYLIPCEYKWRDIGSLRSLKSYRRESDGKNIILNNSDSLVVNRADNKMVVVNDIDDAIVINTNDAVYVTSSEKADEIKDIVKNNHEQYVDYFDYNTVSFRSWGKHELLTKDEGYKVKKVTVAPGMMFNLHKHEYRKEQWTVVSGTPTITLGKDMDSLVTRDYAEGECITVPIGTLHSVKNNTFEDVIIVEIAVGHHVVDSDVIRIGNAITDDAMKLIKLAPAYKDYLWGGTRIRDELKKPCDMDIIAESWELSAHADGVSKVASGPYMGMYFNDYLAAIGKKSLGWKCEHYDRFPILIKFIDAAKPLSIQIHPDDEYALKYEGEYGKNEMWYIMDCDEDSFIYYGTKGDISKEELKERILNNTVLEVLNKVPVKKGDVFYVKTGTVHAIGSGILICEIQQSSNCTYRMYDYDRRDKFGNPRQLHIDKAIDVVRTDITGECLDAPVEVDSMGNEKKLLVQCKYFECNHYKIKDELILQIDEASFQSVIVVNGSGTISREEQMMEFVRGDSFFIPAYKQLVKITGECEVIVTKL